MKAYNRFHMTSEESCSEGLPMQASVEMPPMARLITIIVQAMVIVSAMRHVIIISLNVGTILYVSKRLMKMTMIADL